jgi:hypothetical protein
MKTSGTVQARKVRAHRVLAFLLPPIALLASAWYLPGCYPVGLVLICIVVYSAITVYSSRLRNLRAHTLLRYVGLFSVALVIVIWGASMCISLRIPYRSNGALGIESGCLIAQSGVDPQTGTGPLTFRAEWSWNGFTTGVMATSSLWWGLGRTTTTTYVVIWPLVIGLGIATMLLWYPEARRFPPGHCHECGYNLTGNVSGRCPECGAAVKAGGDQEERSC